MSRLATLKRRPQSRRCSASTCKSRATRSLSLPTQPVTPSPLPRSLPAEFERPSRPACVDFAGRDADTSEVYVIVGGGAAGAVAAESIRLAGFEGRVVMISKEPYLPIDRIKLSKMLDVQPQNILLYEPAYLDKIRVEVLTGKVAWRRRTGFSEHLGRGWA